MDPLTISKISYGIKFLLGYGSFFALIFFMPPLVLAIVRNARQDELARYYQVWAITILAMTIFLVISYSIGDLALKSK